VRLFGYHNIVNIYNSPDSLEVRSRYSQNKVHFHNFPDSLEVRSIDSSTPSNFLQNCRIYVIIMILKVEILPQFLIISRLKTEIFRKKELSCISFFP